MKKILIYPALIVSLIGCNNNKAEREAEIEHATAAAVDSLHDMNERIRIEDSLESLANATLTEAPPVANTRTEPTGKTAKKTPRTPTESTNAPVEAPNPGGDNSAGTATVKPADEPATAGTETTAPEPEEKKKKGINNTVKGAVIGAGAGAVGGAIINKKNPGKGAIIGGVIGAGAGAVTGVIIDKNKKKKAARDSASTNTTTKEPDTKASGEEEEKP